MKILLTETLYFAVFSTPIIIFLQNKNIQGNINSMLILLNMFYMTIFTFFYIRPNMITEE